MKYLVIADTAKEQYSSSVSLFGIFDTLDDALNYIKNYVPKKKRTKRHEFSDSVEYFEFIDKKSNWWKYRLKEGNEELLNETIKQLYIYEFDEVNPVWISGHYE